jgi:hypothetical protein
MKTKSEASKYSLAGRNHYRHGSKLMTTEKPLCDHEELGLELVQWGDAGVKRLEVVLTTGSKRKTFEDCMERQGRNWAMHTKLIDRWLRASQEYIEKLRAEASSGREKP